MSARVAPSRWTDPDYAEAVGKTLLGGQAERGVLICGSGVGASVAANRGPALRAGSAPTRIRPTRGSNTMT